MRMTIPIPGQPGSSRARTLTATQSTLLRLYLVRHGETEWSLSGQHTGRTDIPLTAHGEDEARKLGPCLWGIQFARVLTSPRQRARRTCEFAGLGSAAEIEPDLAEWDYGDYEGQRSVDIRKGRPDWNLFRDGCPRGETPAQVSDRVRPGRAMDRIAGDRRAAFCARRGIAQHSRPRTQPLRGTGHRAVERRPGNTIRWP
jgi:hypothetical protein